MAFGSIEITTITRAQDYSTMKQNEDTRGMAEQLNLSSQTQKTTMNKAHEVHRRDDPQWHENNPDAKEKGHGEYYGSTEKRPGKKEPREKMVVKKQQQGGFDIKI